MTVGGNLQLSSNTALVIYSASTNSSVTGYGALVDVTGDITLGSNAWIYPWCNPTNGGGVFIKAKNVTIPASAGIGADLAGFKSANGCGPGLVSAPPNRSCGGGGYGGNGGTGKRVDSTGGTAYGSSNAPIQPGSGGGTYSNVTMGLAGVDYGGWGGGSIRIQARGTITLNGTLTTRGQGLGFFGSSSSSGGGAGGGIYLACRTIAGLGTGALIAKGGDANPYLSSSDGSGGGGGGRIAVWRVYGETSVVSCAVDGGTGYVSAASSQPGTIVWGFLQPAGSMFSAR
jgi:hypothetical protein